MTTIQQNYMVDALCGSGKTHSAIQEAIYLAAAGGRVAIIQPTLKLSAQSAEDCRRERAKKPIRVIQINGWRCYVVT